MDFKTFKNIHHIISKSETCWVESFNTRLKHDLVQIKKHFLNQDYMKC